MNTNEFPTNWAKGFQHPWRIGAGGTETPFVRDGAWFLRVWNSSERKHYIYSFSTDMFEPDFAA